MDDERRRGPLTLEHDEPGFAIASASVVIVVVWGREARAEDIAQLSAVQRLTIGRHGRCAVVNVIRAGLSLSVDPSVREASAANIREFEGASLAASLVVEAGGLRAAFFRSVLAGIQMVSRAPLAQGVFSTIEEALAWTLATPGLDSPLALADLGPAVHALADHYGVA